MQTMAARDSRREQLQVTAGQQPRFHSGMTFELAPATKRRSKRQPFASASLTLSELSTGAGSKAAMFTSHATVAKPKIDLKPASDVLAGAMARAASQGTIHPLDTLKVRMQTGRATSVAAGKAMPVLPPRGAGLGNAVGNLVPRVASLYKGVLGAASGAGIAVGAYFAFYGAATNMLVKHTTLPVGTVAFLAGGVAAAGGSVVKVPLAVCIRSVQAGVYPSVFAAARSITAAAGVRGLFTGFLPTVMEDVPDMAIKFAAYESMRNLHRRVSGGRQASVQEEFAMGAVAGVCSAAATTPLDVIKTNMMCSAASRPTMATAARAVIARGGPAALFNGVGARSISNGINSAIFFCFFEALRQVFAQQAVRKRAAAAALRNKRVLALKNPLRPAAAQHGLVVVAGAT